LDPQALDLSSLDPTIFLIGLLGLAVGMLVSALVMRARGSTQDQQMFGELAGRMAQLAESSAAQQARMAQQLQTQERALSKALDDRLTEFSKRVGDNLDKSSKESQTTLTDLRERLAVIDRAQKNISELSTQVVGLQEILSNKQARGAFGEIQLHDIVEAILPPSSYSFQETLSNNRRADCLLKLPNPPGSIAIDSKFPLESYEAIRTASGDSEVLQARRTFSNDVRKHVRDIAERYIIPGETAESALMFLPSEAVYAELHAHCRPVVEESYKARVWIVSPTTLMATLNTVRAILKDVRLREQAGVIQSEIAKMIKDVERLDDRVEKLQRHFGQAGEDLRQIRISTEKVTRRGERIVELELEEPVSETKDIAPPRPRLVSD